MRATTILALFLAACSGTRDQTEASVPSSGDAADAREPITRIVYREYREGSSIFIMENEASRDIKALRSKPIPQGRSPVSYVPDDVMRKLLTEFKRLKFHKYSSVRPRDPRKLGAVGELTLIDEQRNMQSLLRVKLPPGQLGDREHVRRGNAYVKCKESFLAVWSFYPPQMQTTTSGGFGVNRVDTR